jgi:hypothetical protein
MGWAVGYDPNWKRDIGYGVPAVCDHPNCGKKIDRGISYVCGGEPFGGDHGCGLFFCSEHRKFHDIDDGEDAASLCECCRSEKTPFKPTPDVTEWVRHKATDPSWADWRKKQAMKGGVE